jgi:hypothetical protein
MEATDKKSRLVSVTYHFEIRLFSFPFFLRLTSNRAGVFEHLHLSISPFRVKKPLGNGWITVVFTRFASDAGAP